MRSNARTAVAMFGGAAAVAWTVGFGGLTTTLMSDTTTTHPSSSVVQERQQAATPAGNDTVHIATLTGCISGANC